MTDYWLSKLFFDLTHNDALAREYKTDMPAVLERYRISGSTRDALLRDDVAALSPFVNAYLLRFYFQIRKMPEAEFISRLHAMQEKSANHG